MSEYRLLPPCSCLGHKQRTAPVAKELSVHIASRPLLLAGASRPYNNTQSSNESQGAWVLFLAWPPCFSFPTCEMGTFVPTSRGRAGVSLICSALGDPLVLPMGQAYLLLSPFTQLLPDPRMKLSISSPRGWVLYIQAAGPGHAAPRAEENSLLLCSSGAARSRREHGGRRRRCFPLVLTPSQAHQPAAPHRGQLMAGTASPFTKLFNQEIPLPSPSR